VKNQPIGVFGQRLVGFFYFGLGFGLGGLLFLLFIGGVRLLYRRVRSI
jgi:hypothetical protein